MKKKLLFSCLLLAAVMLLSCVATLSVLAEETVDMADVTEETVLVAGDVVTISDEAELKAFSAYVSRGGVTEGITFKLESDIALAAMEVVGETNFNPIGGVYNGTASEPVPFKGTFDGNGKTVSGLVLGDVYYKADGTKVETNANTENLGFFAILGEGATVKNLVIGLRIVDSAFGGTYFGTLASKAEGATVENCAVMGEGDAYHILAPYSYAGGILGYAENSVIDRCKVSVKIKVNNGSVAGIVGLAHNTTVSNCSTVGTYENNNRNMLLGGVVAKTTGASSVVNCYSSATLANGNTASTTCVGGIVGQVDTGASVVNCWFDGDVKTKKNYSIGFLVGNNAGTVKDSYAVRDTSLDGSYTNGGTMHYDIGKNNGIYENVFAVLKVTEGDVTTYTVGKVLGDGKSVPCPHGDDAVHPPRTRCYANYYRFEPLSGEGVITDLAGALNAWVEKQENGAEKYLSWTQSGAIVANCAHDVVNICSLRAYAGQEATCCATGVGDALCLVCGTKVAENAVIPVDENGHTLAIYPCKSEPCFYCGEIIETNIGHSIDPTKVCGPQECTICHDIVPAEEGVAHTHPEGWLVDPEQPCKEYTCAACGDKHATDVAHKIPEEYLDAPACKEGIACEVCGQEVAPTARHKSGLPATCTRNQKCTICGDIVRKAKGHTPSDPATCGAAQVCLDCDLELSPATGNHVYDRETADCTTPKSCVNCGHVDQKALGHYLNKTTTTCGLGKTCRRCSAVIVPATGDHIIDLSCATVVRVAEEGRSGIVEGICLDCGRRVEAYTTSAVMEKTGNVLISGGSFVFYAGTHIEATFGAVADYQGLEYKRGYIPLQVLTLSVVDAAGAELALPSEGVTIKIALNKSAALLGADAFKFYKLVEENLVEVDVSSVADGFITFEASELGTFILACDEKAAFEVLGSSAPSTQPEQTAALVGTAAYEKREFDI